MAFKVIWSEPALADLRILTDYIAADNAAAAAKLGSAILHKTSRLAEHPWIGRVVPEKKQRTLRELVQRPYRIIYRIDEAKMTIEIVRLWHAARGEPKIYDPER